MSHKKLSVFQTELISGPRASLCPAFPSHLSVVYSMSPQEELRQIGKGCLSLSTVLLQPRYNWIDGLKEFIYFLFLAKAAH